MTWQTPKTNWRTTDAFTAEDCTRIQHNLSVLAALARQMYTGVPTVPMPPVTAASVCTQALLNRMEQNAAALAAHTFDPGIPATKQWQANGASPTAAELNRIEHTALLLYGVLTAQRQALPKLSFALGGGF